MTASAGFVSALGIDTANPITVRFEFARCMLSAHELVIDTNGIVGSRSRDQERVRGGLIHVNGQIEMEPTALEWSLLLPWIMGGTTSGSNPTTYALGNVMPVRFITVDKVAKVFTYDNCAVSRWTISGSQGQPLRLMLDIIGATETSANAGTFPAETIDLTTQPFVFTDGVMTVGGTTTTMKDFELSCDNHIDAERFFNSRTLATPPLALDRTTTFKTLTPYDSVVGVAAYGTGIAGVAINVNCTNGGSTLNMQMPSVTFPKQGLEVPGRVELMLPIQGTAYRKALASELAIISAVGP
jgi:Phage tail tube protein